MRLRPDNPYRDPTFKPDLVREARRAEAQRMDDLLAAADREDSDEAVGPTTAGRRLGGRIAASTRERRLARQLYDGALGAKLAVALDEHCDRASACAAVGVTVAAIYNVIQLAKQGRDNDDHRAFVAAIKDAWERARSVRRRAHRRVRIGAPPDVIQQLRAAVSSVAALTRDRLVDADKVLELIDRLERGEPIP